MRTAPDQWRTLDRFEMALVLGMVRQGMARDLIFSFFIRPGRVISPAAVNEVAKFCDIEPATADEVEAFMARRISDAALDDQSRHPLSPSVVRGLLSFYREHEQLLPGLESHFVEFKRKISSRDENFQLARTMASFANNKGG